MPVKTAILQSRRLVLYIGRDDGYCKANAMLNAIIARHAPVSQNGVADTHHLAVGHDHTVAKLGLFEQQPRKFVRYADTAARAPAPFDVGGMDPKVITAAPIS